MGPTVAIPSDSDLVARAHAPRGVGACAFSLALALLCCSYRNKSSFVRNVLLVILLLYLSYMLAGNLKLRRNKNVQHAVSQ